MGKIITIDEVNKRYTADPFVEKPAKLPAKQGQSNHKTFSSVPFRSRVGEERESVLGAGLEAGLRATGNVPFSAFNLAKNITQAALSPIETSKGVFRVIKGAGERVGREIAEELGATEIPEPTEAEQTFNALAQSLKERFGSLESLEKTATEDPFGFGVDVVTALSPIKTLATKLPTTAPVISQIDNLVDLSKTKAIEKVNDIKSGVKPKLDEVAISQMDRALELNLNDIRRIKKPNFAGQNPSEWVLDRGFSGSQAKIADDLFDYRGGSRQAKLEGLSQIDKIFGGNDILSAQRALDVLEDTYRNVKGLENEFAQIQSIKKKAQDKGLTLSELEDVKTIVDSSFDVFKVTGDIKSSAKAKGLNNIRDELKTTIEDLASANGFEDVKFLNKETQVAKEIEDALRKRLDVKGSNIEVGTRDVLIALGGTLAGDLGTGLTLVVIKKIAESSRFRTFVANKLKTMSQNEKQSLLRGIETGDMTQLKTTLGAFINEFVQSQELLEEE